MNQPTCAVNTCAYPAPNHRLCKIHRSELAKHIAEVPGLLKNLAITFTRQTSMGSGSGRGSDRPLPFDARASAAEAAAGAVLRTWARAVAAGYETPPYDDTYALALWLKARRGRVVEHPSAGVACEQLAAIVARVRRVIDRPPARVYAGVCGATVAPDPDATPGDGLARGGVGHYRCEESLYAELDADTVRCRGCGTEYHVKARQAQMLTHLDSMLFTPADLARLASLFMTISVARASKLIDSWERRGKLLRIAVDQDGARCYPFGEIRTMLRDTPTRRRNPAA